MRLFCQKHNPTFQPPITLSIADGMDIPQSGDGPVLEVDAGSSRRKFVVLRGAVKVIKSIIRSYCSKNLFEAHEPSVFVG